MSLYLLRRTQCAPSPACGGGVGRGKACTNLSLCPLPDPPPAKGRSRPSSTGYAGEGRCGAEVASLCGPMLHANFTQGSAGPAEGAAPGRRLCPLGKKVRGMERRVALQFSVTPRPARFAAIACAAVAHEPSRLRRGVPGDRTLAPRRSIAAFECGRLRAPATGSRAAFPETSIRAVPGPASTSQTARSGRAQTSLRGVPEPPGSHACEARRAGSRSRPRPRGFGHRRGLAGLNLRPQGRISGSRTRSACSRDMAFE